MAGIDNFDCEGTLTIGLVSMTNAVWTVQADENGSGGIYHLLTTVSQRGSDRIIPGAAGVIPYRRRNTVTSHRLRLIVSGALQPNGTPSSVSAKAQLAINLKYLYDNVVVPVVSSTGTRTMTVVLPGPLTGTGPVHVTALSLEGYGLGDDTSLAIASLEISIPGGRLTWT